MAWKIASYLSTRVDAQTCRHNRVSQPCEGHGHRTRACP
ncbi:hypothetical protein F383_04849 [Gossypium arboreum]|uniref:Uncharacterized protein n=1 Tax=Gossypium arboreum TaxID=29729 RepID=A0A0B0PSI2_GOSAR|nr:hypothetical protein F383_04849 [Gossypium arboreum]